MSRKSDTPVLILSLLITLGVIGAGAWWLAQRIGGNAPGTGTVQLPAGNSRGAVQERLSSGNRLLVTAVDSPQKQAGIEAIANQDYDRAVTELETALQQQRNDPEALIYLNNARIGDSTDYTIAVAAPVATSVDPAQEILRGVAQAQDEINRAGGLNGVPLKVVIASDDNTPETAEQVATALVQTDDVLGVIGHFGSEVSLAAAPIYEQGGLVMISPTSTSVQLAQSGNYVFRTVPSDRFTATALSRYLVSALGQQNAAVFFNANSDYSQSLKEEFTTALYSDGGQIVAEFDLASSTFNPSNSVQQATQQGAEAIVLLCNTATLDPALQVVAVNRQQLSLLGGDSVFNPKVLQVGGAAAEGMVVAVPWIFLSNPNAPFAQAARQLWGGDVSWRSAMAYDATIALAAALRQNPTRSGVQQTLSANGFSAEGATGTVQFLPSGDRNQAMQLVEVQAGTRSGYGYDFVPVR